MLQSFQDDLAFLQTHTPIVLLQADESTVAVAPAFQGRVMTSTFDPIDGPSFGWINRRVIAAGISSPEQRKGTLEEHIHVFGGEERLWLGPEGGQYGLYFEPGVEFEFAHWKTPAAIDTETYDIAEQCQREVVFTHECSITNYSRTELPMGIQRSIRVLDRQAIAKALHVDKLPAAVQAVAYESDNRVTNRGDKAWVPETGLPSIWLLGMYNPSSQTTLVIPFHAGDDAKLGRAVNDDYFGKIPSQYLKVGDGVLFMKGDGTRRGKIGISPQRSKAIAGSYDAAHQVLTLVTYNQQEAPNGYVNSMWEHQERPYEGDVINAYNDGSPAPGEPPMGPFYELETSSPAAALNSGETMCHVQQTFHLQGDEQLLAPIALRSLGVALSDISKQFPSA